MSIDNISSIFLKLTLGVIDLNQLIKILHIFIIEIRFNIIQKIN